MTDWQRTVGGRTFVMSLPVLESKRPVHLSHLLRRLLDLVTRDEGQGMVEYALISGGLGM
jgi:hypothetical protein